jgi:hypothetical protein
MAFYLLYLGFLYEKPDDSVGYCGYSWGKISGVVNLALLLAITG